MDLHHTATAWIMSTEKFDLYKKLYREYMLHLVEMHNHHTVFLRHRSRDSGLHMRGQLRKMMKIEKVLCAASIAAYKENDQNEKLGKRQEKAQARQKRGKTKSKISGV